MGVGEGKKQALLGIYWMVSQDPQQSGARDERSGESESMIVASLGKEG